MTTKEDKLEVSPKLQSSTGFRVSGPYYREKDFDYRGRVDTIRGERVDSITGSKS